MNSNLLFDFSVNKENNTILIKREFAAGKNLVWKAWTTPELLDQWWAPQPYQNKTKEHNFKEGGHWLYAMISPENETHWARFDYEKIVSEQRYEGQDAFCDEAGNIDTSFDRMQWVNVFSEADDKTTVDITISVASLETLEKILEMGFKEGFSLGFDQLDGILPSLK